MTNRRKRSHFENEPVDRRKAEFINAALPSLHPESEPNKIRSRISGEGKIAQMMSRTLTGGQLLL